MMKRKTIYYFNWLLIVFLLGTTITAKAQYATKVFEFMPAPGQFTNTTIATVAAASNVLGNTETMVSLGSFGGYIVVGFDQPIVNDPQNPYGVDFSIAGNSFAGNAYGQWCEPGAVQVMKDLNGDGLPNDGEWYELAGSDYWLSTTKRNVTITYYNPHYSKGYAVPWEADNGDYGALVANRFHTQPYYPDPFDFGTEILNSISFTGTRIRGNVDMSSPSYLNPYRAPAFGYCDSKGNNSPLTNPQNPYTSGTDGFDISWAVDKDGNHVELDQIDFVRIYNAGFANIGWLGEWSTEVLAIAATIPDPNYVPKDYYRNYIGITQLQVLKGQSCKFDGILFKNGRPHNEGTARWWTSDESIATVDNTGLLTAHNLGEVTLYFSQNEEVDPDFVPLKIVELKRVVLEMEGNNAAVSKERAELLVNEKIYIIGECEDNRTEVLNATVANRFVYEPLIWSTSNPEVGIIDNGLFTGTAPGSTIVTARSTSNPELYNTIEIIVHPLPEVEPIKELVKIPSFAYTGTFKPEELFTTGTDAQIYFNSAVAKNGNMTVAINKNILQYSFTQGVYADDEVEFNITVFGQEHNITIKFSYKPAVFPAGKQLLYVYDTTGEPQSIKAWFEDANETKTVLSLEDGFIVKDMRVDGAYLFVATSDNKLYRINLSTYEVENEVSVDFNPSHIRLLANRLYVSGIKDGKAAVYALYKSDLSLAGAVPLPAPATALAATGTKVYVLSTNNTASSLHIINAGLSLVTLENSIALGQDGLTVSDLVPVGSGIFAVRKGSNELAPAVISFNLAALSYQVTELSNIEFPSGTASAVVEPSVGSSILLKNKRNYIAFDTQTLTLSGSSYMNDRARIAAGGVYDPVEQKYYVTHIGNGDSQGSVFSSSFTAEGNFNELGANPVLLTFCTQLLENERPEVKSAIANANAIERKKSSVNQITRNNVFNDAENNYTIYPKNTDSYITWTRSGNNLRFTVFYEGEVEDNEDRTIEIEAIDHYGCATTHSFTLTLKPRIYTPRISTPLLAQNVKGGTEELRLSLSETFEFFAANVAARNIKMVYENTRPDLLTATYDEESDELVLSFVPGQHGEAVVTLRGITEETAPDVPGQPESRYVEMVMPVTIASVSTGIETNTNADAPMVFPTRTNNELNVRLYEPQNIKIYNLSGVMVLQVNGYIGVNTLTLGHLPKGLYFVKTNKAVTKVLLTK